MRSKKKTFFFFLLAIFSLVILIFYLNFYTDDRSGKTKKPTTVTIRGQRLAIETVSTPKKMRAGLGKRDSLCQDCGMLFVFKEKSRSPFWMKNMRFDLDIIWIRDEKIVWLKKNFSHNSQETVSPGEEADMVLEVNAGFCDKHGISPGDKVTFL